jgi:hypothetical protein
MHKVWLEGPQVETLHELAAQDPPLRNEPPQNAVHIPA